MSKINISIDGRSSSGKSSIAKGLAKMLNYKYINTGAMYRAVTYFCINHGMFDQEFDYNKLNNIIKDIRINYSYNFNNNKEIIAINEQDVSNKIRSIKFV